MSRQIAGRWEVDTAGPDDRLAEERCDLVRAHLLDQRQQAFRVVPGDGSGIGHQDAVVLVVDSDAGQRRPRHVHAVISLLPADNHRLARFADLMPVAPGELGGRVDRIGPTRGEEDLASGDRCDLAQTLGQSQCGLRHEVTEVGVVSQGTELSCDCVGDLGPSVTDVGEPQPCGSVEVLVALAIEDVRALAAGDDERSTSGDGPHIREPVPQGGVSGFVRRLL